MADEDQRNVTSYNLRSKRAKPEANEDSKLPALDQEHLDSIRNDRVKLEAFQKKLQEAITKIGRSDLDKGDQYFKLLGKVEVFLDILNNGQVISSGTAVQQNYPQFASSSRHHLLSADDDNVTTDVVVETNSDNDSATDSDVDAMDFLDEEFDRSIDRSLEAIKPQIKKANRLIARRLTSVDNKDDATHETRLVVDGDALSAVTDNKDDATHETRLVVDGDALSAVQDALKSGRVKPFFHTFFLPETFLNSRRSFDVVTPGQVDEKRKMKFDHDADNLDEVVVVDESGIRRGAGSISDGGMEEDWEFSRKQTNFAVELVNTDAQMLGEDIECTTLTSIPRKIIKSDFSTELLTRPESRGVVSNIFHGFEESGTAAITGSPGIGKSWTLYYALQQALIYDGATVLFFFQKANAAVMYLRRDNKIYAWTSTSKESANSKLFNRSDVLVLLDPEEALLSGARYSSGEMKIVYAASNNKKHFMKDAAKTDGKFETFLGPPLDGELNVILARLDPSLKQDVIEARKKEVGNLIRYILSEAKFEARKLATDVAVEKCVDSATVLKQALLDEGMSKGAKTIPGTLFQVLPKRPEKLTCLGYDGHRVEYRERVLQAANDSVRKQIVWAGRKIILSYWGKSRDHEFSKMGESVEELFIEDLTNPNGMVMKRYLQTPSRRLAVESELVIKNGMDIRNNVTVNEVCADVLMKQNVVAKVEERGSLIDAAGPGRKVYQVTVSPGHEMAVDAMHNLLQQAGYIDENGEILREGQVDKLEFYWVVPPGQAPTWKSKSPRKYRGQGLRKLVNDALDEWVVQYALPMTFEAPLTFTERNDERQQSGRP